MFCTCCADIGFFHSLWTRLPVWKKKCHAFQLLCKCRLFSTDQTRGKVVHGVDDKHEAPQLPGAE